VAAGQEENTSVTSMTLYAMQFSDFDKSVKIALPKDARKAVTFQVFAPDNSTKNSTRVLQL
jgi:hypothetical protein